MVNLIREGKTHQIAFAMQTGRGRGVMTFEVGAQVLIQKGVISREDGIGFIRENRGQTIIRDRKSIDPPD